VPADAPLVSVIIPTFNYGRYVTEAVESALAQTYPAVEVIVIDDGSTDDTRERLAPYADRIRYVYQTNAGLSAARNAGIRAAAGPFVAFLDSDDAFHPRKLELQMAAFAADPALGLVATLSFSDEPPAWAELPPGLPLQPVSLDEVVLASRFSPSSVVAQRECFETAGEFDTSLRSVEDRDMWIRVAARCRVTRVELPLTWYRVTPGSMSRNPERMEHFERVVLEKAFRMPELAGYRKLWRKSRGLAALASAWAFYSADRPGAAAARLVRSFAWWPFPYHRPDVRHPWVRIRLLAAALIRPVNRPVRAQ
jgi:glycosyltransferase involved in cell wall biosynthesis